MKHTGWFVIFLLFLVFTAPARAQEVRYYDVPKGAQPHDVAPAPDGSIWYTAQRQGALGRLIPKTGKVEQIPLGERSAPHGVIVGPDGAPWVTDSGLNAIVRVDPATRKVEVFPLRKNWKLPGNAPRAYAVYVDETDDVWLTDFGKNAIVRFDPKKEQFTSFPSDRKGANVRQLLGRKGKVWGAESGADRLVVIRPKQNR